MKASERAVVLYPAKIRVCLRDSVDSKNITSGQQVFAYTTEDILADGKVCIPTKSLVQGSLSVAVGRRLTGYTVNFNRLTLADSNQTISIVAIPLVRGGIFCVRRSGEELQLRAGGGWTVQTDPVISGTRQCSSDLMTGDEFTIQTREDIRLQTVNPEANATESRYPDNEHDHPKR